MRLYLLRHGIAEERSISRRDADRALTPEGIEKTEVLAGRLADYGVKPTIIYSSPLVRARETAEIVAKANNFPMQISELIAAGRFDAHAAQELVDDHHKDDEIMFVGHEPDFSETVSYIIGGGNITMKKGGLARIDLYSQHPLHGTLIWLLAPGVA
jgi:phosphohistidine phosphatase